MRPPRVAALPEAGPWVRLQRVKGVSARGVRRFVVGVSASFLLLAAPTAGASQTVGEDFVVSGGACGTPLSNPYMAVQTGSPGNSYAAPFDGVLTSWKAETNAWGTATLKVVRLGSGTSFTVLAQDGPRASGPTSYPIRVPVRQGDVLGLFFPAQTQCPGGDSAPSTYSYGTVVGDVAPGPGSFGLTAQSFKFPVTAQIEHDADGDGYGDETQDGCPTDATTQGPCPVPDTTPPDTSISKGPKKKTKSKSATFEFGSTEAGSSFECSVDSSGFKPCTSPDNVKVKGTGKHNFLVRARDAAGNLDTSEASYSWKLVKKKPKKRGK